MLGADRDSEVVAEIFDERDPALARPGECCGCVGLVAGDRSDQHAGGTDVGHAGVRCGADRGRPAAAVAARPANLLPGPSSEQLDPEVKHSRGRLLSRRRTQTAQ